MLCGVLLGKARLCASQIWIYFDLLELAPQKAFELNRPRLPTALPRLPDVQGAMSNVEETVSEVAAPLTDVLKEEVYESEHVHQVYERIAKHFSSTRYKVRELSHAPSHFVAALGLNTDSMQQPWPIVEDFLRKLPVGSIGLDVGCGNGKYLAVNPNVFIIGSDR